MAKASVDGVSPEQLPAILLAYKTKGTLNIRNIVQGMILRASVCVCVCGVCVCVRVCVLAFHIPSLE